MLIDSRSIFCSSLIFSLLSASGFALTTYVVSDPGDSAPNAGGAPGDLRYALNQMYAQTLPGPYQVEFRVSKVSLQATLPMVVNPATFVGNGVTIDGGILYRGFFINGTFDANPIILQNMTFQNCIAQGAAGGNGNDGGGGGGGALGAGGAIFVARANVLLENVNLGVPGAGNSAKGGSGGAANGNSTAGFGGGGGGGGLGGNGGNGGRGGTAGGMGGGGGGGGYSGNGGVGGSATTSEMCGGGGGGGSADGGAGESVNLGGGGGGGGPILGAVGGTAGGNGSAVLGFGGGGAGANSTMLGGGDGGGPGGGAGNPSLGGGGGGGGPFGTSPNAAFQGGASNYGGTSGSPSGLGGGAGGGGGQSSGQSGFGGWAYSLSSCGGGGSAGGGSAAGTMCPTLPAYGAAGGNSTTGGGGGSGGGSSFAGSCVAAYGGGGGSGGNSGTVFAAPPCMPPIPIAGSGGFGGGGGGAGANGIIDIAGGGDGGIGGAGGGGGANMGTGGLGGFFAGNGGAGTATTGGPGGGGNGFGGGLYFASGSIQFIGTCVTNSNSTASGAAGGFGATGGIPAGDDVFLPYFGNIVFDPTDPADAITISGSMVDQESLIPIGGGAQVTVQGSGNVKFLGNNQYRGLTTVTSGTLTIDGSISNDLLVLLGGTTKGMGTVFGHGEIMGRVIPETSISTYTFGSLTLDPSSLTGIEISPSQASLLNVINNASVAGTLNVIQDPPLSNYPPSNDYVIIHAGGIITGNYSSITGGAQGFHFSTFLADPQTLILHYGNISTEGLSGNALTLANYLNSNAPTFSPAFNSLESLTGQALKKAINSVSPVRDSLGTFATQNTVFSFNELIKSRLSDRRDMRCLIFVNPEEKNSCCCCEPEWDISGWLGALVEYSHQNAQDQTPAFSFTSEGVLAALDYSGDGGVVGGGFGYGSTQIDHAGRAHINQYYGTFYGMVAFDYFYADFALWGGYHQINNKRHISFPGFDATAKANIHGWQFSPHLELGFSKPMNWGGYEPFVGLDWVNNWENGFKEKGADGLNMKITSRYSSLLRSEIGARIYETFCFNWCWLVLKEKLSYVNKTTFGTGKVTASLIGGFPGSFTVNTFDETQNLASIGFEILLDPTDDWYPYFSLEYAGEYGSGFQSHEGILKIVKQF